jgi:hypothetical protein
MCFVSSLMKKATTTGILFHVVPDHARAALSVLEAVASSSSSSDSLGTVVSRARKKEIANAAMTSSVQSRLHISASLNSIVVELSENRDANAVLSVRLETPSISIVKGIFFWFIFVLFTKKNKRWRGCCYGDYAVYFLGDSCFGVSDSFGHGSSSSF